jgi:hypothetical protein
VQDGVALEICVLEQFGKESFVLNTKIFLQDFIDLIVAHWQVDCMRNQLILEV